MQGAPESAGPLAERQLIEVELASEDQAVALPPWVGKERMAWIGSQHSCGGMATTAVWCDLPVLIASLRLLPSTETVSAPSPWLAVSKLVHMAPACTSHALSRVFYAG